MNILIFFYILFYFVLCLKRLDWAILLLIILLPSYLIRFQIFGIPFTLLEVMILTSFFIWFFRYTRFKDFLIGKYGVKDFLENRKERQPYPFGWEIVLLIILAFVAAGFSGFSQSALGIWKAYFFEPLLFYILVLNVFQSNPSASNRIQAPRISIEKAYWALGISALAVSVFAIYQKYTGAFIFNELWASEVTRRVTSFFQYPNAVGLFLGPIVLVLIGLTFQKITNNKLQITKNFKKYKFEILLLTIIIILSLVSIYFAKSEGALAGVTAGLIVFGMFAGKKIRIAAIFGIILISLGIYAYAPARNFTYEKIILMDHSGQIRRAQWAETWEMLRDGRIIQGSGLANYQEVIMPYHIEGIFVKDIFDPDFQRKVVFNEEFKKKAWQPLEIYLYPHNLFLNFWTELGFFGMLIFVWIITKYLFLGIRNYYLQIKYKKIINYTTLGLICAMVAVVVHGVVDVPYFKNDLSVIFWLLVALLSLNRLEYNKL